MRFRKYLSKHTKDFITTKPEPLFLRGCTKLHTIIVLDHLRRKRYFQLVPLCDSVVDGCDVSYSFEEDELSLPLQRAISMLPPEDRTVLMLRILEEKSYEEIADVLGKCSSTVRKRYERARKKIKQSISKMEGDVIDGKFAVNQ